MVFLCLAMANELVWRNASDADWVFFKTFIAAPASVLFMLAQLPLTIAGVSSLTIYSKIKKG